MTKKTTCASAAAGFFLWGDSGTVALLLIDRYKVLMTAEFQVCSVSNSVEKSVGVPGANPCKYVSHSKSVVGPHQREAEDLIGDAPYVAFCDRF